jgi:hypothetical protein
MYIWGMCFINACGPGLVRSKGNGQGGHDAASGDWSGSRARVMCSASVCSDEGASLQRECNTEFEKARSTDG